ncbi:hypothetical protein KO527_25160 [Pseudoalteromonas sp. C2R02]|uniref:PKD domain-containing protein n=1 Tax=Pseudoalteromonas sp. C2R02 TaxID=2841565 RepID=UPI001C082238|nr:REJ domain-containing protein [Pseudoalteromonas sp. C2R02]MBU2972630.1 hypothetical protein [Pseudoalteromonas sp. C2R02]
MFSLKLVWRFVVTSVFYLYIFLLLGCGGSDTSNNAPIISTSPIQSVNENTNVQLKAQASDSDGEITSILWQQTSGPEVSLISANSLSANFIAPSVLMIDGTQELLFEVTVTDNDGASNKSATQVTVSPVNQNPIVNAGLMQSVNENTSVQLQAQASDLDGEITAVQWRQISGSEVLLANEESLSASFVAPNVLMSEGSQQLVFEVTVTDNEEASGKHLVEVKVLPVNQDPIVSVGPAQNVNENTPVQLQAQASDSDGEITAIQWRQISGGEVLLTNTNSLTTSFIAPYISVSQGEEILTFEVKVTDNDGVSALNNISITVMATNIAPFADAGEDTTVFYDEVVTLDCSASYDVDSADLTYQWQQLSGDALSINKSDECKASIHLPDNSMNVEFELKVTDEDGLTDKDTIKISSKAYEGKVNSANISLRLKTELELHHIGAHDVYFQENLAFIIGYTEIKIFDVSNLAYPKELSQFNSVYSGCLVMQDEFLFVLEGNVRHDQDFGVQVIDLSNPEIPEEVASFRVKLDDELVAGREDCKIQSGNLIYLLSTEKRHEDRYNDYHVSIFDITDVSNPSVKYQKTTNAKISNAFIEDNKLFVATPSDIAIYDLTNEDNNLIAQIEVGSSAEAQFKMLGNYIYYLGDGFKVIDVSLPDSPVISSDIELETLNENEQQYFDLYNGKAFIAFNRQASKDDEIKIIDISLPESINIISAINIELSSWDYKAFSIYDDFIYHSYRSRNQGNGVKVIDVTEVADPKLFAFMPITGEYDVLQIFNGFLYAKTDISEWDSYSSILKVIDVSDKKQSTLQLKGSLNTSGFTHSVKIKDDFAYLADGEAGFKVLNIKNKSNPNEIGGIDNIGKVTSVLLDGHYAFIQSESELILVDVSIPSLPVVASRIIFDFTKGYRITQVKVKSMIAYLPYDNTLSVMSFESPTEPKLLTEYILPDPGFETSSGIKSVHINGDFAYLTVGYAQPHGEGWNTIKKFNIAQPSDLNILSAISFSKWGSILNVSETAIYANYYGRSSRSAKGFMVFNNQDGGINYEVELAETRKSLVLADEAYFIDGVDGLEIADLNSLESRLEPEFLTKSFAVYDVALDDNYIYVASGESGLNILDKNNLGVDVTLDNHYQVASTDSLLSYKVSWQTEAYVNFNCSVTGGHCIVDIDAENKTAEVIWQGPTEAFEHEIVILAGNNSHYKTLRDKVIFH